MNPQETEQVVACDQLWVPTTERVNISTTNVRLETTVKQKEETFQVVIDVIKNSTCFKAFTISADYVIDVEVFRKILDICPRKEGEDFTEVQNDEDTLTFLIDLGYSGPLHKYTNMFVDHMHQPWRTLAACINKCLSGKTASNDKLKKSIIDILWGMFYKENVDYPSLIWEDIAYQIDHRREKKSRRENMSYPRSSNFNTFTQLRMTVFQIPPKKSRGKGLQGKKTADTTEESVDVSDESDPEPLIRRNNLEEKLLRKKVTNISDAQHSTHPEPTLHGLENSISLVEAKKKLAAEMS
ncbi:hypothetical protein Tco_0628224 [Tanacetum coccineum]|uniref:Transposase n=1 Tax=Tanacetum coccineum TaxID=301880 RepID=A0ABQ4WPQ4_9ASTR